MVEVSGLVLFLVPLFILGFLVGFLSVKVNHVLIILLGRLFSSGTASQRYIATGLLASLVVFVAAKSWYPDLDLLGAILSSVAFLGFFGIGVWDAQRRFSTLEYRKILEAVLDTFFPDQDELPGALKLSSSATSQRLLDSAPESMRAAVRLFLVVFDSRTMVFLVSFRHGKLTWKRFIDLPSKPPTNGRARYLQDWRDDPLLSYGAHVFRILFTYTYYIKDDVWPHVHYNGELLRRSYLE